MSGISGNGKNLYAYQNATTALTPTTTGYSPYNSKQQGSPHFPNTARYMNSFEIPSGAGGDTADYGELVLLNRYFDSCY